MDLIEGIRTRRSIRKYTDRPITREQLREIVRLGTMAPSGLNNQPWRFVTIQDRDLLHKLAPLTKYAHVIEKAPACIAVFIDKNAMYHETKDHQAMGACIQNMLLAALSHFLDPRFRGDDAWIRPRMNLSGIEAFPGCCQSAETSGNDKKMLQ